MKHAFFRKTKQNNKPTSKCGSIVHSLRQESLCRLHTFMSHQMLLTKGQGQGQQFVFFYKRIWHSPWYRNSEVNLLWIILENANGEQGIPVGLGTAYGQTNLTWKGNTVVHIKWEEGLSAESEGRQCADGRIARNGQVPSAWFQVSFSPFWQSVRHKSWWVLLSLCSENERRERCPEMIHAQATEIDICIPERKRRQPGVTKGAHL